MAIMSRPVNARLTRTAAVVASAPFLPKRTFSAQGMISTSFSASSTSARWARLKMMPFCMCRAMDRLVSSKA